MSLENDIRITQVDTMDDAGNNTFQSFDEIRSEICFYLYLRSVL